jgi:hypothetical protein
VTSLESEGANDDDDDRGHLLIAKEAPIKARKRKAELLDIYFHPGVLESGWR